MENSFENTKKVVESVLTEKRKLDVIATDVQDFEGARKLATKYWALISNLDECLLDIGNICRTVNKECKLLYAKLISKAGGSEASKKREAENSEEYITKIDHLERYRLYKAYVTTLRDDIYAGHNLMKATYKNEVSVYLSSPRAEA